MDMEKMKHIFMILSLVFIILGLGACIWLYTVLQDTMSLMMIAVFFIALVWFGLNVKKMTKKE